MTLIHQLISEWEESHANFTRSVFLQEPNNSGPAVSDEKSGTLKLTNLSLNMSGKYVCNASNAAGSESCFINLEIVGCKRLPDAPPPLREPGADLVFTLFFLFQPTEWG